MKDNGVLLRKGYMNRIQISHNIVDEDLLKEVKKYMNCSMAKIFIVINRCDFINFRY